MLTTTLSEGVSLAEKLNTDKDLLMMGLSEINSQIDRMKSELKEVDPAYFAMNWSVHFEDKTQFCNQNHGRKSHLNVVESRWSCKN